MMNDCLELVPSVDERGLRRRPFPTAVSFLSSNFSYLVQTLDSHSISNSSPLLIVSFQLLKKIVNEGELGIEVIRKSGLMYYLLGFDESLKMLALISQMLCFIVSRISPLESPSSIDESKIRNSFPELFLCLPEAIISNLKKGPQEFAKIFTSNFQTPTLIWNSTMRQFLSLSIRKHLENVKNGKNISEIGSIDFNNHPIQQIDFSKSHQELEVAGYFVRYLNEASRNNSEWQVDDPESLLNAIVSKLKP